METTSVNLFSINGPNNLFSIANDELNTCAMNQYLSDWNKSIESHLCSITNLQSSEKIILIVNDYNALKADRTDIGFNLFTLISDLYYRENFHRDVIYEFLNQNGSHKKGNKYLMLFLDMLNIDYNLFNNAIVEKEYL
ncbi:MAG: PD-(D/E)XK nuclease family protein [Parabacteroides sp.]|nr:PD-(D/E)XK nuclease family protein [Parabacteroides sp.]